MIPGHVAHGWELAPAVLGHLVLSAGYLAMTKVTGATLALIGLILAVAVIRAVAVTRAMPVSAAPPPPPTRPVV